LKEAQPTLVIFSGLPGTGKSTIAYQLAQKLHWPLLVIDDVIGEVPENPNLAFWDSKVAVLLDLVETQLSLGLDVIVESVFMNMDRQYAQELARKHHARFLPIYVFVSDNEIWEERVTARCKNPNNKHTATWEQVQHQREHFREWEPQTALFIDSIKPVEQNFDEVLNFVVKENVVLNPLSEIQLVQGKYHN
jgi:predicted kinase